MHQDPPHQPVLDLFEWTILPETAVTPPAWSAQPRILTQRRFKAARGRCRRAKDNSTTIVHILYSHERCRTIQSDSSSRPPWPITSRHSSLLDSANGRLRNGQEVGGYTPEWMVAAYPQSHQLHHSSFASGLVTDHHLQYAPLSFRFL